MLRPGNAGSNTANDHITAARDALRQLPFTAKGGRIGRKVLIRTDAAGATHDFLDWLVARKLSYSLGFTLPEDAVERLARIPAQAWTPAYDDERVRARRCSCSPAQPHPRPRHGFPVRVRDPRQPCTPARRSTTSSRPWPRPCPASHHRPIPDRNHVDRTTSDPDRTTALPHEGRRLVYRRPTLAKRIAQLRRAYTGETDSTLFPAAQAALAALDTAQRRDVTDILDSDFRARLLGDPTPTVDPVIRSAVLPDTAMHRQQELDTAILLALGRVHTHHGHGPALPQRMVCRMVRPPPTD
jgi:hypothetical protein